METNDVRKYESTYALAKAIDDNEGLEHIRVKLDIIELDMDGLTDDLSTAQSRITTLTADIARYRVALKPFADIWLAQEQVVAQEFATGKHKDSLRAMWPLNMGWQPQSYLTVESVKQAARALTPEPDAGTAAGGR